MELADHMRAELNQNNPSTHVWNASSPQDKGGAPNRHRTDPSLLVYILDTLLGY